MKPCLFCSIIEGKEAAVKVYEDEHCMAFMDIFPISEGHVLLIPKAHSEKLDEQDKSIQMHLYLVSNEIIAAQRKAGLGVNGTHFLINDGKDTNQHIQHVHIHLIPRKQKDNLNFAYKIFMHFSGLFGFRTKQAQLEQVAQGIRQHMPARIQDSPLQQAC